MRRTGTRTGLSNEVRILLWTAAGVVVAALVALITSISADAGPAPGSTGQTGTAQTGGTVINNNNGFLNFQSQVPPGTPDADVRAAAATYATTPPPVGGPAPYRVVDTQELGLKVRTTPDVDGVQIGSAANATTLWVDCVAITRFDPVVTDNVDARWLRVRWPTTTPGTAFHNSDPGSPQRGWVYAGLTVPAGHDGKISTC